AGRAARGDRAPCRCAALRARRRVRAWRGRTRRCIGGNPGGDVNEPAPAPAAASPPAPLAPRPGPKRVDDRFARAIAVAAIVATVAALWISIDSRLAIRAVESSAGGRLAELGAEAQGARGSLAQTQTALKEAQARIAELETRMADTQEQRVALEE